MGFILDTKSDLLDLEERMDSFYVRDKQRRSGQNDELVSDHIVCYGDGTIEVSKEFLLKLVCFFDSMENRKRLYGPYKNKPKRQ